MADNFLDFVMNPSREAFLASRGTVVNHEEYNPYSDDIANLKELLDAEKYDEVINHNNINTLLSPRAHIYKKIALDQKGMENDAKSEMIFAQRILENIELTGNGTQAEPYVVTRVEDEHDFLTYLEEKFVAQSLRYEDKKVLDAITTENGKEIWFDITMCYMKSPNFSMDDFLEMVQYYEYKENTKPWWKFW